MTVQAAKPKNIVEYPYLPTVGRKIAAIVVETAWFNTKAMLMPFDRMRVGMSSESASHTHTPGPTAKKAMNTNRVTATIQPFCSEGTGVIKAFSMCKGACRAASRFPNGLEKKATILLAGTQLSRVMSIGFAAGSSDRTAWLAVRKSP